MGRGTEACETEHRTGKADARSGVACGADVGRALRMSTKTQLPSSTPANAAAIPLRRSPAANGSSSDSLPSSSPNRTLGLATKAQPTTVMSAAMICAGTKGSARCTGKGVRSGRQGRNLGGMALARRQRWALRVFTFHHDTRGEDCNDGGGSQKCHRLF